VPDLRAVIATFDDEPPIGGQGRYVGGLRAGLRRRGVEVRTVAGHGAAAVRVPRVTGRPPLDHSLALLRDPRPLLAGGPDVIHAMGGPGGVLLVRRLGVPVVYTAHHTYRQAHPLGSPRRLLSPVEGRCYRIAAAVLAVSPSTADAVLRLGVAAARVEVLPPGIEVGRFDRGEALRDPGLVLFVGRLEPEKRPLDAVAVMARLGPGLRGMVIGGGSLEPAVRAAAAAAPPGAVEVRGAVSEDELLDAYATAAMLIVPSRYEGLGLVALEAMAAGAAVVAYDVPGLRDAVAGRGRLVPSGDLEAMVRACVALTGDPAERFELAARARDSVVAAHSWDAVAARVEAVYRAVGQGLSSR
jgi:glycosyltransferase involved in cell wall biosynthesis